MERRIWILVSLLLVFSLFLAACGQQITAEEIVAKMQETLETTEDAHAVVYVIANFQGEDMTVTAEVWQKKPHMARAEVLEASRPELDGMVMVSDGEQGWFYDPDKNRVMVGPADEIETPLPQETVGELQKVIQEILDLSDVELIGNETVAGRDAYKLTLTPKEDAERQVLPGNGVATLWVDQEQWFVLKAMYVANAIGEGTVEVQSFELNPGLPGSLFTFEVPEGAEIVDVSELQDQQPEALTLDEARAQAGFPLLVPEDIPGDATLIEVFKMGDSIILRYDHSPDVSFAILQGSDLSTLAPFEAQAATMIAERQDVTVRGQDGTAIIDIAGGNTVLYWTENGVTITVVGHLSLDQSLQVAESLN